MVLIRDSGAGKSFALSRLRLKQPWLQSVLFSFPPFVLQYISSLLVSQTFGTCWFQASLPWFHYVSLASMFVEQQKDASCSCELPAILDSSQNYLNGLASTNCCHTGLTFEESL